MLEYPPETEPYRIKLNITSDNWAWARDKAQSLKYEAVFETVPRTNSIDSMKECTKIYCKGYSC